MDHLEQGHVLQQEKMYYQERASWQEGTLDLIIPNVLQKLEWIFASNLNKPIRECFEIYLIQKPENQAMKLDTQYD